MYLEKFRLDGRVAVVTGGGQGIGFACAQALGEAGATVVVADIDLDLAKQAENRLRGLGVTAHAMALDVTNPKKVAEVATEVRERHGPMRVLVNNAGIAVSEVAAENTSDALWRKHMDVNLDGVFYCCREFGRIMLETEGGSVINMGSMSGFIVNKPQEQTSYNTSKAAVHHLTRSLAAEWAKRRVRVNAVAPTYIATPLTLFGKQKPEMFQTWLDMTPMGRLGEPEEVASAVLFLASDASSLLTGSIIVADGGYTCW